MDEVKRRSSKMLMTALQVKWTTVCEVMTVVSDGDEHPPGNDGD